MASARMPVSMATSLTLHAGAFAAYFFATHTGPVTTHYVPGVELQFAHRELPPPTAPAPQPKAQLDKSFLWQALPDVHKISALDVTPREEAKIKPMIAEPKLDENKRKPLAEMPKLDLGAKHVDHTAMATLDAAPPTRHSAAIALPPRLDEVGVRKVRNLPQALLIEDRRMAAMQQATLQGLNVPTHTHVAPAAAMKLLDEAPPEKRSGLANTIANMLPPEENRHETQARMGPAPDQILHKMQTEIKPPPKRADAAMETGSHKAVEIEGALKDRQVVASAVPPYPERLKSAGIPEVVVKNAFCVDPSGEVVGPTVRTVGASGFGWLDRLTQDFVKQWKFAPLGSSERQCGAITFRFELE